MKNLKTLKSLARNETGSVLIMVGVFILITFAIAGAAIDFGRAQLLKMKQQQATDAAALAAANVLPKDESSADETRVRETTAKRYYNLNVPATYLGVTRTTPSFVFDKVSGDIIVANNGSIATNYITTLGNDHINVAARTKVNIPEKNTPDFDVVMVIDQSASTSATPNGFTKTIMETEKEAVNTMLDVLFPTNQDPNPDLRFGLIGYSGPIINAFGLTSDKTKAQSYVTNLKPYYMNYDMWGLEAGMKMLTADWKGFKPPTHCDPSKEISIPRTPVAGCVPVQWLCGGVTTNSPGYCYWADAGGNDCTEGGYWFPACLPERNTDVPAPIDPRTDKRDLSKKKYIVFITDGLIMDEPGADGKTHCNGLDYNYYWTERYPQYGNIDNSYIQPGDTCRNYKAFLRQCDELKKAGNDVEIFTINFYSRDPGDEVPMQQCASSGAKQHYFFAPTGAELQNILTGIANQMKSIRITD